MYKIFAQIFLVIQILILLYFFVVNGTCTLFILLSLRELKRYAYTITHHNLKSILTDGFYRPLSIIVPAYNEELTITSNVRSLLALKYPEFEVVVINDGSKDGTMEKLIQRFRLVRSDKPIRLLLKHKLITDVYISLDHPNLIVINKENGGKADALNAGINVASFPIFCCIDADSMLENEALLRAARLFAEDKEVVATGGIVRVLNGCKVEKGVVQELTAPQRVIECFQAVEYTRGFLSGRTAWNAFGSLLIISGAFGLFRKDIVQAIGGYRNTVGEDMDLVVRMHRHCREKKIPYRILFVPDPVCFTQVPSDLKSLLLQRNRWHRGLIDSLLHSKRLLLNPKYGTVGLFAYPYFTFIEALGPLVEILGYINVIVFYLLGAMNKEIALLFFVVAILWGIWINIGSILLDNILYRRYKSLKDIFVLCLYSVLEMFGYRQLITLERLFATFQFWKTNWGHPTRQQIDLTIPPS